MNQYRCETCKNKKCIWNHENPHAYSGIPPHRKLTLASQWANNFMERVGCASHSDFQSEREVNCPICGAQVMRHYWCIDSDCGWDSLKEERELRKGGE